MDQRGRLASVMREDKVEIKNSGFYQSTSFVLIIICWGILLRLTDFLFNRSLWLDELMLALNIINKDFYQLLGPLDHHQGAPAGFLMVEKLALQLFGNSEYALRLFPLISGIISLVLFYSLAKRTITPKAVPIALGFFAISGHLIYYSSEVKQYSSDVTIAILLLAAAIYVDSCKLTPWRAVGFGILGAVSIWFSHPSVFILAGIGMTLTVPCLTGKRWARIGTLSIAYSLWALSFASFYFISLRHLAHNDRLFDVWTSAFVPSPIISATAIEWFVRTFFDVFKNPVGFELSGLAAFTFVLGCISMLLTKREKLFILILPIFVTLIASGFHKYPFSSRLLLFITPALLLLVAEGTVQVLYKINEEKLITAVCLIGFLSLHPFLYSTYHLLTPRVREEIKPVMTYTKEHLQEEDVLYVFHGATHAYQYYAPRFGLDRLKVLMGVDAPTNWSHYEKDLEQLRGHRRVWLLFSHIRNLNVDEEKVFLYLLNKRGTKLDSFKSDGAAVYLYDFEGGDRRSERPAPVLEEANRLLQAALGARPVHDSPCAAHRLTGTT
jgi:hypothetical protein